MKSNVIKRNQLSLLFKKIWNNNRFLTVSIFQKSLSLYLCIRLKLQGGSEKIEDMNMLYVLIQMHYLIANNNEIFVNKMTFRDYD